MAYLLNALYLLGLALASPWLVYKACTTGKYRRGMGAKFTGRTGFDPATRRDRQRVWFHGVSVGEIHLLRQVVARFREHRPDCDVVVSTTTDTGFDEAKKCFTDLPVLLWPLDFSWAVQRALRDVQPSLIVLAEGEIWPNLLAAAKRHGIPVAIVNARMSPRSASRYAKVRWLARLLFARIDRIAAQTEEYAEHFRALGAPDVHVTGSVKYDGAHGDRQQPRTRELRRLLGLADDALVWVVGSTQAPEEDIALTLFARLRQKFANLHLILVPRQKDRFDEVARLVSASGLPFARRSQMAEPIAATPVVLVDTIGELNALWGLADVAYVGGSLDGKRGGQNMIEPAAYGAAVVFGPHTWNFKETVTQLLRHDAALRIADAAELEAVLERLFADAALRTRLGDAARTFVLSQQGATARTLKLLDTFLPTAAHGRSAA